MSLKRTVICIASNIAEDIFAKASWMDSNGALDKKRIESWFKGTKIIWDEMDKSVTHLVISRRAFKDGNHEALKFVRKDRRGDNKKAKIVTYDWLEDSLTDRKAIQDVSAYHPGKPRDVNAILATRRTSTKVEKASEATAHKRASPGDMDDERPSKRQKIGGSADKTEVMSPGSSKKNAADNKVIFNASKVPGLFDFTKVPAKSSSPEASAVKSSTTNSPAVKLTSPKSTASELTPTKATAPKSASGLFVFNSSPAKSASSVCSSSAKSSTLKSSPLKSTPLKSTPLKSSALKSSPIKSNPSKSNPVKSTTSKLTPAKASATKPVPAPLLLESPIKVSRFLVPAQARVHTFVSELDRPASTKGSLDSSSEGQIKYWLINSKAVIYQDNLDAFPYRVELVNKTTSERWCLEILESTSSAISQSYMFRAVLADKSGKVIMTDSRLPVPLPSEAMKEFTKCWRARMNYEWDERLVRANGPKGKWQYVMRPDGKTGKTPLDLTPGHPSCRKLQDLSAIPANLARPVPSIRPYLAKSGGAGGNKGRLSTWEMRNREPGYQGTAFCKEVSRVRKSSPAPGRKPRKVTLFMEKHGINPQYNQLSANYSAQIRRGGREPETNKPRVPERKAAKAPAEKGRSSKLLKKALRKPIAGECAKVIKSANGSKKEFKSAEFVVESDDE